MEEEYFSVIGVFEAWAEKKWLLFWVHWVSLIIYSASTYWAPDTPGTFLGAGVRAVKKKE